MARPTHASQPKTAVNPDRMTTLEAAAFVGLSHHTLRLWRAQQREDGPPYLKLGRSVFYRQVALEKWMERNTVNAD